MMVPGAIAAMVVAKSRGLPSGEPLIVVITSPASIPALAAGLPASGRSKIAPYGTAIPKLLATGAVIGLISTPIHPQDGAFSSIIKAQDML
jgi:hypothetical protein